MLVSINNNNNEWPPSSGSKVYRDRLTRIFSRLVITFYHAMRNVFFTVLATSIRRRSVSVCVRAPDGCEVLTV